MKYFCDITSLFTDENDRNIDFLKNIYNDKSHLRQIVSHFLATRISASKLIGKRILLKPNWVRHPLNDDDLLCLTTNSDFLLAVVECIATYRPSKIIIGDAPVQSCNWEGIVNGAFLNEINFISNNYGVQIQVVDFRRRVFMNNFQKPKEDLVSIDEYVLFDLGTNSFLEEVTENSKNRLRITSYSKNRLALSHSKGKHVYCITKELFNADIVISVTKIKTHEKVGITNALKNIVGLNGDKDYLPHHRYGGTGFGGDCYPGKNYLRLATEKLLDIANDEQGKPLFSYFLNKVAKYTWILSLPNSDHNISAGWYGNDTTWRMVLDLNKIVLYGNQDGTLSDKAQRDFYTICDGIIGGQGNGPLKPVPIPLGIVAITNNSAYCDFCMARILRFDFNKLPLIKNSLNYQDDSEFNLTINSSEAKFEDIDKLSIKTIPPDGWSILK